jgi:hypothetical protein
MESSIGYFISAAIITYCLCLIHGYTELSYNKRSVSIVYMITWQAFAVIVTKFTGFTYEYLVFSSLICIWITIIKCGWSWARGDIFTTLLWEQHHRNIKPKTYVGEIYIGPPDIKDWQVVVYKRLLLPTTYVYTSRNYPTIFSNTKQHD